MARSFEIHPAIGICRVGQSTEFFLGPEPGATLPLSRRGADRLIKKQAVRFRIFQCDRDERNNLLSFSEVILPDQRVKAIEWRVHVSNRKGAAPKLLNPAQHRNHASGDDLQDALLIIDPGEKSVTSASPTASFVGGKFKTASVDLGSMTRSADGRLTVLGGSGEANFIPQPGGGVVHFQDFADNDDWFDTTSDGPVRALLTLADNTEVEAKSAWVVVAPPDFAPAVNNAVTRYDIALQAALDNGFVDRVASISFQRDVFPILKRLVDYQWVNQNFAAIFGPGKRFDFAASWSDMSDPAQLRQLKNDFIATLRKPGNPTGRATLPPLHDETNTARNILSFTAEQYRILSEWAKGNASNDFGTLVSTDTGPDGITRVASEAAVGGAFFPGIEAGAVIARRDSYISAFRLNVTTLKPGRLTQGNAVPWQADFAACATDGPGLLNWWPAQRPDDVFLDMAPLANSSVDWAANVNDGEDLVKKWGQLGFVIPKRGAEPAQVETERTLQR